MNAGKRQAGRQGHPDSRRFLEQGEVGRGHLPAVGEKEIDDDQGAQPARCLGKIAKRLARLPRNGVVQPYGEKQHGEFRKGRKPVVGD